MADAHQGQGSKLYIATEGSPTVFVQVAGIKSFDGPDGQATIIDKTDLDSTFREKLMGLPDEGNITFQGNYVGGNAGQDECFEARSSRERREFRLDIPAGAQNPAQNPAESWYWFGYVTQFSITGGVDGLVECSIGIAIDGAIRRP
jgi:hypothetical protein